MKFERSVITEPVVKEEVVNQTQKVEVEPVTAVTEPVPMPNVTVNETESVNAEADIKIQENSMGEFANKFAIPEFEQTIFLVDPVEDKSAETVDKVAQPVDDTVVEPEGECSLDLGEEIATVPDTTAQTDVAVSEIANGTDTILVDVKEEIIPEEVPTAAEPTVEIVEEVKENIVEEPVVESQPAVAETWGKFVDNVIIPTFMTVADKIKDYIKDVIAKDLKDIDFTDK